MITIVFKMTIKKEKEKEFKTKIIPQLVTSANANNCVQYNFYQSLEIDQEFILHEKWKNEENWNRHLHNLITIFGEKAKRSILPK